MDLWLLPTRPATSDTHQQARLRVLHFSRDSREPQNNDSSKTEQVHTEGGAFVGRDQQVQGDLVKGDKIIHITTASSPTQTQNGNQSAPWRRAVTVNTILTGKVCRIISIKPDLY